MDTRKGRVVFLLMFMMFALSYASPTGVWTKTKDSYLMSCIDVTPKGTGEYVEWVITKVDYDCLSKMIMLENVGTLTPIQDDVNYVDSTASTIDIPFKVNTQETKIDATTYINLKDFLDRKVYTTYSTSYTKVSIGLATEEWELIYYENVTIGICDSGVWSQYSNCTPSANWTVEEKQVYANVTVNETFWKINGTLQNYTTFQIWSDIHSEAYDNYIYFNYLLISSNVTSNILTTSELIEGKLAYSFNYDFENQTIGNAPEVFVTTEGGKGTIEISDTQAKDSVKSIQYIDNSTTGSPNTIIALANITNTTLISFNFYVDSITNTGDAIFIALGGEDTDYQVNTLTLRDDNSINIYPDNSLTPLSLTYTQDTWYNLKMEVNFTSNKIKYWLNDNYMGSYNFRNNPDTPTYLDSLQFAGGATQLSTYYVDDVYSKNLDDLENLIDYTSLDTYELGWTTGWAYCTSHDNCTESFYCTLSGDEYSLCQADLIPTTTIENSHYYMVGTIDLIGTYEYDGTYLENATGNYSIDLTNGTHMYDLPAVWNPITEYYEASFNSSDAEYYINLTLELPPIYATDTDSAFALDVLSLNMNITYPTAYTSMYSSTIFPSLILTLSEFYNSGNCRWILNGRATSWFIVTNNVTYDNIPLNLINNVNYLIAECEIGGITITKDVTFKTVAVPDPWLLGINLNAHLFVQEGLLETKGFLNEFGLVYLFWMTPLSILMAVMYLFIKMMRTSVGDNKK